MFLYDLVHYFLFLKFIFSSSLQSHNTRSQKGEKEKEKQPNIHLDSDEDLDEADLSLMNRTKRLAKEKAAKAADLRRQLAELEDPEDSPIDSDVDPDPSSKDMGAFVAAAVSFFFYLVKTSFYQPQAFTNEPLERVDSFDVLLDINDSGFYPGFQHRFVGLLFY